VALTSEATGQGDGSVAYRVSENTDPTARRGTIAVNNAELPISQDAAPCQFGVSPASANIAAAGGSLTVHVDTHGGCTWTASSASNWIQVVSGAQGNGPGTATLAIAANAGGARTGTLTIPGQTVTIFQSAVAAPTPCTYAISPTSRIVDNAAQAGTLAVTARADCAWTAVSNAAWIALGNTSGTGSGSVRYSTTANTGPARMGTITVADQTFTLTQGNGCSASLSAASQSLPPTGGTGTVTVMIASGCTWTASSNANWLTITNGSSSTGNGAVAFAAAPNVGAGRSGTLSIAGRTFTVTEAACSFSIAPNNQALGAAGGTGSVAVTAPAGCSWAAVSNNTDWLTVTNGSSGSGNGSVAFAAGANAGAPRTGTLTVAGQTFTVSESAPCGFSIAPASQTIDPAGGTAQVTVMTSAGCGWTAVSNNSDWIAVASGASGSGSGSVILSIAANSGAARTGTVTVAGQTFTVTQDAGVAPCTYAISPASQDVAAAGGSGSVALTTGASCSWTATSNSADWLAVTSAASGTGSATIVFGAAANATGAPRTGTITIGGETFSVNQAGS
jgi:hypothetical protein